MAREAFDIFQAFNKAGHDYEVIGCLVDSIHSKPGTLINDIAIPGDLDCTIGHDALREDLITLSLGVPVSGNVRLHEGCCIGTGAVIIKKKSIGEWSPIGMGSVVIADLPAHSVIIGIT